MSRTFVLLALLVLAAPPVAAQDFTVVDHKLVSPSPYPPNQREMSWTIRHPGAGALRIWFEEIDVEDGWDWIEIYHPSGNLVQKLTGRQSRLWTETVDGDTAIVKLRTDGELTGRGFMITRYGFLGGPARPMPDRPAPERPAPERPAPTGNFPARIDLQMKDGARWVPIDRWNPIDLYQGGCPHGHLDVAIQGFDESGRPIANLDFNARVRFGTGGADFGTLEPRGGNAYRFHAGTQAARGVLVAIFDPRRPEMAAEFFVNVGSDHRCGTGPQPEPARPQPQPGSGPQPQPVQPQPLPGRPSAPPPHYEWMQVGSPWRQPNVRPDSTVDLFFAIPAHLGNMDRYKLVATAPVRIRYLRVDFHGGRLDHRYITNRDFVLQPGEEFGFDVPFPPGRGGVLYRVKLGMDAHPGTELRLLVMVPR